MKRLVNRRGFTLAEVLLGASLLAFCLCGILLTYMNMFVLNDLSRDSILATNAAQAKIEEIKNAAFDTLSIYNTDESKRVFSVPGFVAQDAKGQVEIIDTTFSNLKIARVIVCFKSRDYVIGEDKNLDGAKELGTGDIDQNGNGILDSPVELVTLIVE